MNSRFERILSLEYGLFALSVLLGGGMSWSQVSRRLSRQADVDGMDE